MMLGADSVTRDRLRTGLLMLGGLLVTLYVLAPFSWLVLTSFMHEQDALSVPPQWIPQPMRWQNYIDLFNEMPFLQFTMSHSAVSHLSTGIAESSITVPVFIENLAWSCLP